MLVHSNTPVRVHQPRRGLVLLVVLAMLALFASVAVSFVFYAESAAEAARQNRLSLIILQPEIDPEVLAAYFLNQLIYDTDNIYSAMRGHSFSRSIYGYNPSLMNDKPYNGVGRSALSYPDPDLGGLDNYNFINYQTFYNPAAPAADKTLNFVRTPEYMDKIFFGPGAQPPSPSYSVAGAPTYRYVGGADPPWTSYDTNSLFLAEMTADGRVLLPSFRRPWTTNALAGLNAAQQAIVRKYMSLRPDGAWHPGFSGNLPDQDANGDVKNMEFGPGGNDSIWIDIGAPVMTAPDGRRYKPLFAVLITDLASKLNLFAHGNNTPVTAANANATPPGVSNMGLGTPEVNLNALIANPIVSIQQVGGGRLVTTTFPHGLSVGQTFMISGVSINNFNNVRTVVATPSPTVVRYNGGPAGNLGAGGFVYDTRKLAELQRLYGLRYFGPGTGTTGGTAAGNVPRLPVGTFASQTDGDGSDGSGYSTKAYMTGFRTTLTAAVPPAGLPAARTVTVAALTGNGGNAVPWAIEVNQRLSIDTGAAAEVVTVTAVNYQTGTITATFTQPHAVGSAVVFNSYFGFPAYPATGGWNNGFGETANVPLAYNLLTPTLPNIQPIPMSNQEAPLRYNGTGSPALTSEIFRRMPNIFSDIRARNMVTISSWSLDRITAAPHLNFDRTGATPQYVYNPAVRFPLATPFAPPNFMIPGSAVTSGPPNWNSDFSGDWRSNLGNLLRLDLNRPLTDYPISPTTLTIFTAAQLQQLNQAVADRQKLATDTYNALVRVTGARDPNVVLGMAPNNPDYQACRYLAQLAVNIVDYVDNDDYLTPFNWNAAAAGASGGAIPSEWVFGTEIPRLVLNEVYAQHETTVAAAISRIDVFAELQNPLLSRNAGNWNAATNYTAGNAVTSNGNIYVCIAANTNQTPPNATYWQLQYPVDNGAALLSVNTPVGQPLQTFPVHRIITAKSSAQLTVDMRDAANNLGDPNYPNIVPGRILLDTNNVNPAWGPAQSPQVVLPANGGFNVPLVTKQIAPPTPANPATTGARQFAPGVVEIHTTTNHGFQVGHAVTITGVTDPGGVVQVGYEGTYVITQIPNVTTFRFQCPTAVGTTHGNGIVTYAGVAATPGNRGFYGIGPAGARYANANRNPNLPATFASPAMSGALPMANILAVGAGGASEVGTTVTIQTVAAHGFGVGDIVVVAGVAPDAGYNGTWTITTVPNGTSFTYTAPAGLAASGGGTVSPANCTVILQRLANPHMPPQLNPAAAFYNPYVTVDFMDRIRINPDTVPINPNQFVSAGRRQPYDAQIVAQTTVLPNTALGSSFFQQNDGSTTPFTWLVHLDRPPVNPLEMMHVSGFRAHELTQLGGNFGHYAQLNPFAPGQNLLNIQNSLLYRSFDLIGTRYQAGLYAGGRVPGRININTMTDFEVFLALCDPHTGPTSRYPNPWFTQPEVQSILTKIIQSRTGNAAANFAPAGLPLATSDTFPQGQQRPFKSFAAGDVTDTVLRPDPTNAAQPLFAVGAAGSHPYARSSLLQKVFNNITTTSDTFAVWCTVGYFEVVDESVRPVRLGNEVGRSENRHIRHRMFAIVDRSGLQLFNTNATSAVGGATSPWVSTQPYGVGNVVVFNTPNGPINYTCIQPNTGQSPGNAAFWLPVQMNLSAPFRTINSSSPGVVNAGNIPTTLVPGMLLEIDSGQPSAEVVAVVNVTGAGSFTANFTRSHGIGASVVCRGNPGPQKDGNYNPRRDTNVVLHLNVIQ